MRGGKTDSTLVGLPVALQVGVGTCEASPFMLAHQPLWLTVGFVQTTILLLVQGYNVSVRSRM